MYRCTSEGSCLRKLIITLLGVFSTTHSTLSIHRISPTLTEEATSNTITAFRRIYLHNFMKRPLYKREANTKKPFTSFYCQSLLESFFHSIQLYSLMQIMGTLCLPLARGLGTNTPLNTGALVFSLRFAF